MFYLVMSRRPLVCLHIPDSYELAWHCLLITGVVADPRGTCSLVLQPSLASRQEHVSSLWQFNPAQVSVCCL